MHCCTRCPWPCSRPLLTHASAKDSWTLMGKSGSVSCGVTAPFFWVLVCTRFCLCSPSVFSPVLYKFWQLCVGVNGDLLQEAYAIPKSAASRAPAPAAVHCWPVPPQETLKHGSVSASVGLAVHFSEMYFIILRKFPSIPCLWTFSFYFLIKKECSI